MSQPAVSKHLPVLGRTGLVRHRREGRRTRYRARLQGLAPLVDWMSDHGEFWRDRLDRLESVLEGMDR